MATAISGPLDLPEKYHMNIVGEIPLGWEIYQLECTFNFIIVQRGFCLHRNVFFKVSCPNPA